MTDTPQPPAAQLVTVQGASNGLATAALVVGVIALALSWIPLVGFFGFILGLVAVGIGIGGFVRARARALGRGTAIAGLALGGFAVVVSLVVWSATLSAVDAGVKQFDADMQRIGSDFKAETAQREACMDEVQRKQEAAADRHHEFTSRGDYSSKAAQQAQREYMDTMDDGSICY
ncbi:MAG: DUF4190 domain-containing protein [Actinomycetota bacterium]|nr:DUF4190 domain-containing protein [Actinomycetota bacterium]